MVARQRALADFGEFALRTDDLDAVLTEACRLVSRAMHADLAKVLEIEEGPGATTLFVRAGVGWPSGVVGKVHLAGDELTSETFAVAAGKPVITPDIEKEDRFEIPDFMQAAGVMGMINVPIFLPGGKAYGLLQVDSRDVWNPTQEDTEFLRTYATILGPVIDRLHKLHALDDANDRNATLLRELQHRIKNNIAVIASLVRMRRNKAATQDARNELGIIDGRIAALSLAHEHVYTTKKADRLALRSYATQLLERLLVLHGVRPVRLDIQIEDLDIASDTAIPLGLILNEFTTNSMKHAFTDEERQSECLIAVEAKQRGDALWIRICDNGGGLPNVASGSRPGSGTGMALIAALSQQIGAKPDWRSDRGTALSLEFPHRP
ncbi:sensor histidine kinase [Aureimonas sp. AU4]|uniref:sensor histidine kinase n=1 Tax=Aureimonas sp. AU4 TaxID=1638163 RepID=UPI000A7BE69B|nr:histidine kinase dimerization/phosphoacceptor domain -containing protein [Aureimonas sp. AU4]